MGVSKNRGTPKNNGCLPPKIIHFNRVLHEIKPSILGGKIPPIFGSTPMYSNATLLIGMGGSRPCSLGFVWSSSRGDSSKNSMVVLGSPERW